jgi:hypothetical protein
LIEVAAVKAKRPGVLHLEQIASAAALSASPIPDRLDDNNPGRSFGLRHAHHPWTVAGSVRYADQ